MSADLDTLIRQYGERLDAWAPTIDELAARSQHPGESPNRPRPRWAVAIAAAAVVLLVIGGGVALGVLFGGGTGDLITPDESIPESWTTYTASDGIVSDCLCSMVIAGDGSIWVVGFDGISRFNGTAWERIEPPRPFHGEGWPLVVASPDGSIWVSGIDYLAQFKDGAWSPLIEAGFGMDEGDPLGFQSLAIDETGRVWTGLGDQEGVIEEGVFQPFDETTMPAPDFSDDSTDPMGVTWGTIGDSIDGVDGALIQSEGDLMTAHELGGVRDMAFEADGTRWFLVHEVGPDAWMFGQEQWSAPGLYRLENGEWTRITTEDGLPEYRFSEMELASDGSLWIATAVGTITHYQPGTNPTSGNLVDIPNRPFTETEWPTYPPPTHATPES